MSETVCGACAAGGVCAGADQLPDVLSATLRRRTVSIAKNLCKGRSLFGRWLFIASSGVSSRFVPQPRPHETQTQCDRSCNVRRPTVRSGPPPLPYHGDL